MSTQLLERGIAPHGPFRMKIEFELDAGEDRVAHVEWTFPPGVCPTADDIAEAAGQVAIAVREQIGECEWPTRKSFIRLELQNRIGVAAGVPDEDKPFEMNWAKP